LHKAEAEYTYTTVGDDGGGDELPSMAFMCPCGLWVLFLWSGVLLLVLIPGLFVLYTIYLNAFGFIFILMWVF
jgi:hypothetical protein